MLDDIVTMPGGSSLIGFSHIINSNYRQLLRSSEYLCCVVGGCERFTTAVLGCAVGG